MYASRPHESVRPGSSIVRFLAVTLAALICSSSCSDGGPAGVGAPTLISLSPELVSSGRVAAVAPISRIRVTVSSQATGAVLSRQIFDVSPDAAAWDLAVEVDAGAALGAPVLLSVELMSVVGGVEQVEWSGRIGPIDISSGDPQVHPIAVYPGPLENLDVIGLSIVDPVNARLLEGETLALVANIVSASGAAQAIWSSLDEAVAVVTPDGVVSGLGPGGARIVAQAGPHADTVSLTVLQALVGVEITPDSALARAAGDTVTFQARGVDPRGDEVPGVSIVWSVQDPAVARHLGGGRFETLAQGSTTVGVTASGPATVPGNRVSAQELTATAKLVVMQGILSLGVSPGELTFAALGETATLVADPRKRDGTPFSGAQLSWRSTNTSVATVDGTGQVTAVGNGTARVIVSGDGLEASADVHVVQTVASLSISPESHTLRAKDETVQFDADVRDSNDQPVLGAQVSWSSSDPEVASIDQTGLATAHKSGSAEITAEVADGGAGAARAPAAVMASANLLVDLPPAAISLEPEEIIFTALGESRQARATVMDAGGTTLDDPVTWGSSDAGVVSVSTEGEVVAVGNGSASVTATAGPATASLNVTVTQLVDRITVDPTELTLLRGEMGELTAYPLDFLGNPIASPEILWRSSDGAVAQVVPSGANTALVTGVGGGSTVIRAISNSRAAEALVTVIGGGGDGSELIVAADIDLFSIASPWVESGNQQLATNLTLNGERSRVVWFIGHGSYYGSEAQARSYWSPLANHIENTLGMTLDVIGDNELGLLAAIPPEDVAVVWVPMPSVHFSELELDQIQAYLAGGGRIVLFAEHAGFPQVNAVVTSVLYRLGSDMSITGDFLVGNALPVVEDPITAGVDAVYNNASSWFTLGDTDLGLFENAGKVVIFRAGLGDRRLDGDLPSVTAEPADLRSISTVAPGAPRR